jgi:hypothetical protein
MNADYQYLVGKIQSALATDPRTGKLDIRIMIAGGKVHLTGETATETRRRIIEQVVAEAAPELEIRNQLTVVEVGEPARAESICD